MQEALAVAHTASLCTLLSCKPIPTFASDAGTACVRLGSTSHDNSVSSSLDSGEHCSRRGTLSRNFKNFTICATGSPFLMVPTMRAGPGGEVRDAIRGPGDTLKSDGLSGGQQSSRCGGGHSENSPVNKSHVGFGAASLLFLDPDGAILSNTSHADDRDRRAVPFQALTEEVVLVIVLTFSLARLKF